ncbi:MAG: hypothetical protein WB562_03310 [Candidatus Sulfotelmatobacter sp.]
MYTGTLIKDLMATVERAEHRVEQRTRRQQSVDDINLRMLEAMYSQPLQTQPAMAGAA